MIEPTDEMIDAFRRAFNQKATDLAATGASFLEGADITRAGLAAVLAIVERDHEVRPYCNEALAPGIVCKRMKHNDDAGHYATAPGGSAVTW